MPTRFLMKEELLKPRLCSCGCGLTVTPNPMAMTARNKPLYATEGCRLRVVYAKQRKRGAARRKKAGKAER